MNNNISSQYTKLKNKEDGRHGYGMWKKENISIISPKNYGLFIQRQKHK